MGTTEAVNRGARAVAEFGVSALLVVLASYLPKPRYSESRLLLFGLVAGAALLGGVGVVRRRPALTLAGAVGLLLLGFSQATLGVYAVPVAVLLLFAGFLEHELTGRRPVFG
ncbi:MAG: hypothetical protein ABEJ68_09950 [Halobacteriaceae archaeon]